MTQEYNKVDRMVLKKKKHQVINHQPILFSCRVPALPVKNLTGSGPLHPALAGEIEIDQIEHIHTISQCQFVVNLRLTQIN